MPDRIDPVGIPIHDDDETIARALDDVSVPTMVWWHPSISSSWYRNPQGRVTVLSPWRLVDYWRGTQEPALDDCELA